MRKKGDNNQFRETNEETNERRVVLFVEEGLESNFKKRVEDLFLILVKRKIVLVETVFKKSIFRVDDVAVLADTDEEVNFFTGVLTRVPGEVFGEFVSINHNGGLLNGTGPEKHVGDLAGTGRESFLTDGFTLMVDELTLATNDDNRGMLLECF